MRERGSQTLRSEARALRKYACDANAIGETVHASDEMGRVTTIARIVRRARVKKDIAVSQRECNFEMIFNQSQRSHLEKGARARRRRWHASGLQQAKLKLSITNATKTRQASSHMSLYLSVRCMRREHSEVESELRFPRRAQLAEVKSAGFLPP
eukprot:6210982-Pleurochrysis_carterae.AAC.1